MNIEQILREATSPDQIALLLQAMGQTSRPSNAARPDDPEQTPIWRAQGEFFGQDMRNIESEEAARLLLNSMGQTGPMSVQQPAPAQTQQQPTRTGPLTAEEQAFVDAAPSLDELIKGWGVDKMLIAEDRMAEDAKFRDIPKTGVADTRGGVARVNQYTPEHGVMATMDDKGRVTLTNIDPKTGKPTPQSQRSNYGFNTMDRTSSASVNGLLDSLRQAKNADEARGILGTINNAFATESASLQQQALVNAEKQLGLPQMKERLAAAEALDRATPGWVPGMGDSKNTASIRTSITALQDQARQVANDSLNRNITFNQLKAAAQSAELEFQRIQKVGEREDARAARLEDFQFREQYESDMRARQIYDSLSTQQKMIAARTMPPELIAKNDPAEVARFVDRQLRTNPKFREVMETDPMDVPKLAIGGNSVARDMVVAEEATITGTDQGVLVARMREAQQKANTDEAINAWTNSLVEGMPNPVEAARTKKAELMALKSATGREQQAEYRRLQGEIALNYFRQQRNQDFRNNVTSWSVTDPAIQAAVVEAQKVTGKADMITVLRNYVGQSNGPEALAKYQTFKEQMLNAAGRYKDSPFGALNASALAAEIDDNAIQLGGLGQWFRDQFKIGSDAETLQMLEDATPFFVPNFVTRSVLTR